MSLKITPTGFGLGAELSGVDLTKAMDDATFEQVKQAFMQHEVIIFRDHELSDEDHLRFSGRFGELRNPPMTIVSNIMENGKYIGAYDVGEFWHTDGAAAARLDMASALRAIEVPEKDGRTLGATAFASMTAAYDALSPAMKKRIEGLQALHSRAARAEKTKSARGAERQERGRGITEGIHPVAYTHPVTGRKCLFVSEGFTAKILGVSEDESKELLAELTAHLVQPRFVYTHHWRVHDLVMWDNVSTQHKATFDYEASLRRRMHRTVVTQYTGTPSKFASGKVSEAERYERIPD